MHWSDAFIPVKKLSDNYYYHLQLENNNKKRSSELDNVLVNTPSAKKRLKAVPRSFTDNNDDDGKKVIHIGMCTVQI